MERADRKAKSMLIGIRFSRLLFLALLLSLVRLPTSHAQNGEPFKFFRDYVGLHEDQKGTDNADKNGFYLITIKGSQQTGLTGFKGSIVRKVTVDKTRSSLERALGTIKQKLEPQAG